MSMCYMAGLASGGAGSSLGSIVGIGSVSSIVAFMGLFAVIVGRPLAVYVYYACLLLLCGLLFAAGSAAAGYVSICDDPRNQCAFVCCGSYTDRLNSNTGE